MNLIKTAFIFLLPIILGYSYGQFAKSVLGATQWPQARFGLVPATRHDVPVRRGGADVIFVHGLGSHPEWTWLAPRGPITPNAWKSQKNEDYVNWVSDLLPQDLPPGTKDDIRLYFYNYDSYWKRDSAATRLASFGNNLLENIIGQIQGSQKESNRHLIFVGHSYGGLVIKQALVQAHASREFKFIADNVKAILFLGTPHRGSRFGFWGWVNAKVLYPMGSNSALLANLEYDSIALRDLHMLFVASVRNNLDIFNFYEERPLSVIKLGFFDWKAFCVREESATYHGPGIRNIGLGVNHFGLNKFVSRNDSSYQMIVSKLREVIVPLTRQATRHYHIPSKTVASYTQRDDLWSELEEKLKVHHKGADIPFAVALHGLGGAGKSQLALKYAETSLDHYSSVIWIDATDEASIRASFFEFAQEMGLVASQSVTRDNEATQKVLKWLRDQTGFNGKWLVILDNADDLSLDIQRVIPKGPQGTLIITSQDERSPMLVKGGCEYLHVAAMTPIEGRSLLLQHLPWDLEKTPSEVQNVCDQLSQMLGYLALAVDLAGAYIGNDPSPEQALTQYLKDFKKHRDQMLQTDDLRSLTASGKTVWTVWTTTLERIGKDYGGLKSGMLLTFLAHFDGKVIPNELFRLASQGMSYMDSELGKAGFSELRDFIAVEDTSWDSFHYRRALDVLARYSLVQRLGGDWTGVTMHDLVRWRARKNTQDHPWKCWHAIFVLAACQQFIVERYWFYFPDLLTTHIQNIKEGYCEGILDQDAQNILLWRTAGKIHYHRWEWNEAQRYYEQLSDALRIKFGEDHNHTLSSMSDLASVYINQGKKDQAMELYVRILQLQRIKIGNQHPITLRTMSIVAHQYWKQGRVDMAQSLYNEVMEARMINFGAYSSCKFNLAELLRACWQDWQNWKQGLRGNKIEKFYVRVMVAPKLQLVNVYPGERTESIILHIASDYFYQGQLFEAEKLFVQALEAMKVKLGDDNISLFYESINLARIYTRMGRYDEAEDLYHHIIKKNTRDDQLLKRLAAQGLAWLYQAQGRDDEGQRLWDQMVRGRSDHHRNPSARRSWIPAD